jgi:hypothetical protein
VSPVGHGHFSLYIFEGLIQKQQLLSFLSVVPETADDLLQQLNQILLFEGEMIESGLAHQLVLSCLGKYAGLYFVGYVFVYLAVISIILIKCDNPSIVGS